MAEQARHSVVGFATLGKGNRVVLPGHLVAAAGWSPGEPLTVIVNGNRIILRRVQVEP